MASIKPSVLQQLQIISKTLEGLIDYEGDVCGDDYTDAIVYSKIQDMVDEQITEINQQVTSDRVKVDKETLK